MIRLRYLKTTQQYLSSEQKNFVQLIGGNTISNRNVEKKAKTTMNGKCSPY